MTNFDKLVRKLSKLFELEKADLDFGIHRIIKARQKHIRIFLGLEQPATDDPNAPTLQKIVQREMGELNTVDLERQLESVTADIQSNYGRLAFDTTGKLVEGPAKDSEQGQLWMELQEQLDNGAAEANLQLEAEIYSHLTEFFARYYDEADFLSKRRIKAGDAPYAVPYSGEEVMLHWANKDQYYIKSSKDLKDYTFTLPERFGGKRVQFKCERQDPVLNNNKAKREFHIDDEAEIEIGGEHIVIPFHFKIVDKTRTQKVTKEWIDGIVEGLPTDWQKALRHKPEGAANDLITRHLSNYTRKNESDFFIHKHLGKFLRNELDFYIKNEVMHLDDIDAKSTDYLATRVRLIKALRTIALHIITFLAQLENFQKKLWLKKKYVTETNYCITLDRIIENAPELISEITSNERQREAWVELFSIDEISADEEDQVAYTVPLTEEFIRANPYLVADTGILGETFKWKLVAAIDDIDEQTNGTLFSSENSQALRLISEQKKNACDIVYIDPPYNTSASEIIYKNQYKHSSWLALIEDRLVQTHTLMKNDANICATIDDVELNEFSLTLDGVFGRNNEVGIIPIRINPSGRPSETGFALTHEYALFYRKTASAVISRVPRTEAQLARFNEEDEQGRFEYRNLRREGSNSDRADGQRQYYPIYAKLEEGTIRIPRMEWNEGAREWSAIEEPEPEEVVIYPINDDGAEKNWRWSEEKVRGDYTQFLARTPRNGTPQVYYKYRARTAGTTPLTLWTDTKYSATEHGTNVLKDLFEQTPFTYPKSIYAVEDCLRVGGATDKKHAVILDYFAGSGTTGHAVINLNREDHGSRKYILVEMGEYFDVVTKPRIQKVIYSPEWKDGRPLQRDAGSSHCFKYIRLESYEDALNNLNLGEDRTPDLLGLSEQVREDYLFSYLLDVETRKHLMNLERFRDPWGCQLKIHDPHTGKAEPKVVDLVETFNYLLGVTVREVKVQDGFLTLEGESPSGETVLIVWRKLEGESDWPTTDNEALKTFITERRRINTAATEYHAIYINGDHTLEDPQSKIHCIEEEFYERMFENTGNPED